MSSPTGTGPPDGSPPATPETAPATTSQVATSWQQACASEQSAIFGYGVLGPRLAAGPAVDLARDCEQAHRALLQTVTAIVAGLGQRATATGSTYVPPFPVVDDISAQRLAVELEESCARAWRYALAVMAGAAGGLVTERATSVGALRDSAVRAVRWRRRSDPDNPSVAFPGI